MMHHTDFTLAVWTEDSYQMLCEYLTSLADPAYRQFHQKLIPGVTGLLGIRIPVLRGLAKAVAKGNFESYFSQVHRRKEYGYEEVMLYGMVIGLIKSEWESVRKELDFFVPLINNWAVCDTCCAGLKIAKKYPDEMLAYLQKYLRSKREYELRFAAVMLMDFYIEEAHVDTVLNAYENIRHEGYYVKMAVAWGLSVCFVKFRDKTLDFFSKASLDDFTYQKALQKIVESDRVSSDDKALMRKMKQEKRLTER